MANKKKIFGKNVPEWLNYVQFIANHKEYMGMPDCYSNDGTVQWEAPSNRQSGKFKDTHIKRLKWWEKKATSIGISIKENQWISRTAKKIHPTREKVCKNCGKSMFIGYYYPTNNFIRRMEKHDLLYEDFSHLSDILSIIKDLHIYYGDTILKLFPKLLATKKINCPQFIDISSTLNWIDTIYVPAESNMLSPGAMSNAPDRFDGFHSFNLCCRKKVDKGRSKENLKSYVTDRRVFECWADGDWISADRMMGLVRSKFQNYGCINGHDGDSTADHIGPISLGFCHRPEFQLLCRSCNSTKNNRMSFNDVNHLRNIENNGIVVISWHSRKVWDLLKNKVDGDETALRISKILRDNRHIFMGYLLKLCNESYYYFLSIMLKLKFADYNVNFINANIQNHFTKYDELNKEKRTTKYSSEQKIRRLRIAFNSLHDYLEKKSRNVFTINDVEIDRDFQELLNRLKLNKNYTSVCDDLINKALLNNNDSEYYSAIDSIEKNKNINEEKMNECMLTFSSLMGKVALKLESQWNDERYRRNTNYY